MVFSRFSSRVSLHSSLASISAMAFSAICEVNLALLVRGSERDRRVKASSALLSCDLSSSDITWLD